jgi:hypothetical protein
MGYEKVRRPILASVNDEPVPLRDPIDFSTSEQDTGVKWIDGSTIYQKTVAIAAGPNNTTVNTAHGITGLLKVVDVLGFLDNGTLQRALINTEASATAQLQMAVTDTNVVLLSGVGGDYSGYAGHATLRYTKS